jgi:hypothetical protein
MYRPWLFQNAPKLAKRIVEIRNFCQVNKEYFKPYIQEDEEMLDFYTEHLGNFFSCYRKATPQQRWEYLQAFAQLNESFQNAVTSKAEGEGHYNEDVPVSNSFRLFFEAFYGCFRSIMGMSTDNGLTAPFRSVEGKEKGKLWCSLNGFKWSITIEREKI